MAGESVTQQMLYEVITRLQDNIREGTDRRFNALRDEMGVQFRDLKNDVRTMQVELSAKMDTHQRDDDAIATRVQIIETKREEEAKQRVELAATLEGRARNRGALFGVLGGLTLEAIKLIVEAIRH